MVSILSLLYEVFDWVLELFRQCGMFLFTICMYTYFQEEET